MGMQLMSGSSSSGSQPLLTQDWLLKLPDI